MATGPADAIRDFVNAPDFIVATTHTVPVYGDAQFDTFMVDLYLGSRVTLAKKSVTGYEVVVPYRRPDGSFATATGWVKPDASVSVGYQSFTQRTVIATAFNMLYRPYSWADGLHEWDCCGMMREVLRTFGIKTGRWTSYELHATDHVISFPRKTVVAV